MFEAEIKLNRELLQERNLDYNKVMAYIDKCYDEPHIQKVSDGHYIGVSHKDEFAEFGVALLTIEKNDWLLEVIDEWYFNDLKTGEKEDVLQSKRKWDERHQ